ncbi:MAG: TonB family protein, partial [Candidatus Aminicenantes bacterium]
LRLLAPPLFAVDLPIPDFGRSAGESGAAVVAVSGGGVSLADSGFSPDPRAVIALVWAAGALMVIGFAIAQSVQLRQILAASGPASPEIASRVAVLSRRLGLRRAPPTVQVLDLVPPMLWAFLGSVRLILPSDLLARLDPKQTDTLLAHELAHLSRRDHWVRHLELAALAVFWWNPIAWWATKRVRRAQELCCDQRVAELLPENRRAYADCLVETARFLSGRGLPLGSPARAMADMTQMKGRIRMIMSNPHSRRLSLTSKIAASVILVAAVTITPMLTAQPEERDYSGEPITLSIKDADLNDVLATFAKISGYEILVEPGITGTVTMNVEQVPWDGALVSIVQNQGLEWERSGNQIIIRRAGSEKTVPAKPVKASPPAPPTAEVFNSNVHKYVEGGEIEPPEALDKLPPKYPPEMRKAGISGRVVAELVIDQNGVVRDVAIQESPAEELSAAATEAFEQWTFEPATMDGKPVAVRYIVTVEFKLK